MQTYTLITLNWTKINEYIFEGWYPLGDRSFSLSWHAFHVCGFFRGPEASSHTPRMRLGISEATVASIKVGPLLISEKSFTQLSNICRCVFEACAFFLF